MPSREKRVRRRQRGYFVLPVLIFITALAALALALMLVSSNPLETADNSRLPFAYPENPNFVDQANATVQPLILGGNATPESTARIDATPEITPEPTAQPAEGETVPQENASSRLIPAAEEGDYFLPVFDRALRTPNDEAMIAVTVDDCDNAEVMSMFMKVARNYGAKLTLFPTGEALMAEGMSDGFKTCVRSLDYELENHSYAHKAEYKLTSSELAIQLWKQSIAASYAIGRDYQQHFYRPYNINSAYDQRTHFYAAKLGYKGIASYSHSYKDFKTLDDMVASLENGKVYQFDMSEHSAGVFEQFIAAASRKGYKLVTMNTLFGLEENTISDKLTLDEQTLITMEDYVPTYYDLKLNYRTNAVFSLQARLMQLGYLVSEDPEQEMRADGIYGASTSIAVSAFQAKVGIIATGNADVATQEALFDAGAPVA